MVTDVAGADFGWAVARGVAAALCVLAGAGAGDAAEELAGAVGLAGAEAAEQAARSSRAPEPATR
jgi:hypothetical protein